MPLEIAAPFTATGRQVTIRTSSDGLRGAAVWQMLMPLARNIKRVRVATHSEREFEDMTIRFARCSRVRRTPFSGSSRR